MVIRLPAVKENKVLNYHQGGFLDKNGSNLWKKTKEYQLKWSPLVILNATHQMIRISYKDINLVKRTGITSSIPLKDLKGQLKEL